MKMNALAEKALSQIDTIGYQLNEFGITDQFNRHNCIAFLMNEQIRFKGELDSIQARVGTKKVQIEKTVQRVEDTVNSLINTALTPARSVFNSAKNILG